MVAYDDNSVDVIDLTSNSHIGTNTRNNYYHILKKIMTFLFTNSPVCFVFRLKKYISPSIYKTSEDSYGNKFKIYVKIVWIILP